MFIHIAVAGTFHFSFPAGIQARTPLLNCDPDGQDPQLEAPLGTAGLVSLSPSPCCFSELLRQLRHSCSLSMTQGQLPPFFSITGSPRVSGRKLTCHRLVDRHGSSFISLLLGLAEGCLGGLPPLTSSVQLWALEAQEKAKESTDCRKAVPVHLLPAGQRP
jgi:hypothetical protein